MFSLQVVRVEVIASISTADILGTTETWEMQSILDIDPHYNTANANDREVKVTWQRKRRIDNGSSQHDDGNCIARALSCAWRGGH